MSQNILLIQSNPPDAKAVLKALGNSNDGAFQVEWVESCADGLKRMAREGMQGKRGSDGIVAVLVDLSMPDGQGIRTFNQLVHLVPQIPILVLTASRDEDIAKSAVRHGAWDYILKDHLDSHLLPKVIANMIECAANADVLFEEKERAQVTLNSIGDAVMSASISGDVTYLNPAAEKMMGWSLEEAAGRPLEEVFRIIDGNTRGTIPNPLRLAIQENRAVSLTPNCVLTRRDGVEFTIEDSVTPIHDRNRQVSGAVIVFRDVSKTRMLSLRTQQAQKMEAIGNLTGGMAHDFNNLLSVIIGNLDILGNQLGNNEEARSLSQAALDAALRGADLTRRMLAFASQQPLQPQQIDVNKLTTGITKLLSRTLGEDIQISLNLAADVWPIMADPAQLEAALTNLATNARDAMPRGGRLTIATSNGHLDAESLLKNADVIAGDYVVIEVSDNGAGMPPGVITKIFEPFFTTKGRGKGTGLGLAMVFGFMKQSGGHINVQSKVGSGTAFRLYLPRVATDRATISQTPAPAQAGGGHETILVVEDNEEVRRIVVRQLGEMGYRVLDVGNAVDAIAMLTAGDKVDLLFTDIVMPGQLNGLELARVVAERWPALKVVLTSGFPETKLNGHVGSPAGMRLLSKPYRKTDLAHIVRETLEEKTAASYASNPQQDFLKA